MKILAYMIATGTEWQRIVSATASAFKKRCPDIDLLVYTDVFPVPELLKASEIHKFSISSLVLDERYKCFGHNFIQDYTRMERAVAICSAGGYDYILYLDADVMCMRPPHFEDLDGPMKLKDIIITPDHPVEGPKRLAYFKDCDYPKIPRYAPGMLAYGSFLLFPIDSTLPGELVKEFGVALGKKPPEDPFFQYMFAPAIVNMVLWRDYLWKLRSVDRRWGEQVPEMMTNPDTIFEHIWWSKEDIIPTFKAMFGKYPWEE